VDEPDAQQSNDKIALHIREMEIDDLSEVFHLGETLFKAEEVPNMYRTWDPYEVVGLFQSDSEYCLVAEIDDRIVGFALGTTITKSHSAWKYGYLIWLGIHPKRQRHKIAEKLFRRFKAIMVKEGARILMVDTQAENLPALRLFQKLGFDNPQKHIYLTMNLAAKKRKTKRAKKKTPPAKKLKS